MHACMYVCMFWRCTESKQQVDDECTRTADSVCILRICICIDTHIYTSLLNISFSARSSLAPVSDIVKDEERSRTSQAYCAYICIYKHIIAEYFLFYAVP
jgi:hypothetical protein